MLGMVTVMTQSNSIRWVVAQFWIFGPCFNVMGVEFRAVVFTFLACVLVAIEHCKSEVLVLRGSPVFVTDETHAAFPLRMIRPAGMMICPRRSASSEFSSATDSRFVIRRKRSTFQLPFYVLNSFTSSCFGHHQCLSIAGDGRDGYFMCGVRIFSGIVDEISKCHFAGIPTELDAASVKDGFALHALFSGGHLSWRFELWRWHL